MTVNEWVAVAYEGNFYLRQIEKIFAHKVGIKFLTETKVNFHWPQTKDWAKIGPEFIFCRNVEVNNDTNNKSYQVK